MGEIEQKVGQETQAEVLEDTLTNMKLGGFKVSEMIANAAKYANVMKNVAQLISSMSSKEEMKAVAEEVAHILCLIGVMRKEMYHHFKTDNAETTWRELLKHAELIHEEISSSYRRNEAFYKQIYELICTLLPENCELIIQVASSIAADAWPRREAIAKWIAYNWKETLCTVGKAGTGAMLFAFFWYVIYLLWQAIRGAIDDNRQRRRRD